MTLVSLQHLPMQFEFLLCHVHATEPPLQIQPTGGSELVYPDSSSNCSLRLYSGHFAPASVEARIVIMRCIDIERLELVFGLLPHCDHALY